MKPSYEVWQDKNKNVGITLAFIYLIRKTHMGQHASLFLSCILGFFSPLLF